MSNLLARSRGTILIVTMISVMVIAGVTAALFELTLINSRAVRFDSDHLAAFQVAEGGLDRARAIMIGSGDDNGATVTALVTNAGASATAVRWNASTRTWVAFTGATWDAASDDLGIDGIANTNDQGEGDGFPTAPSTTDATKPGEPNVRMFRWGSNATDTHYFLVHSHYWGDDGLDNNNDGNVDGAADTFEDRTYTLRATGIVGGMVVELETLITRDPPAPPLDPNNPPGGFLSALSLQVGGAITGTAANIHNNSAVNTADGTDTQTSIAGAGSASSTNDTTGVMLATKNPSSLQLTANRDSAINGTGGTPSFNQNGTFMGDIVDTIADGVRSVAKDTSGNPSDYAGLDAGGQPNQNLGSTTSLSLVYHDYDQHGTLAIPSSGFGVLVVDATSFRTDSSGNEMPFLQFTGSNTNWDGIVIVRVKGNFNPTTANGAVLAAGAGGSPGGQRGSVLVYAKGAANFTNGSFYKNNGNRPTYFSMGAVQSALQAFTDQVPPTGQSTVDPQVLWRPIRQPGMVSGGDGR